MRFLVASGPFADFDRLASVPTASVRTAWQSALVHGNEKHFNAKPSVRQHPQVGPVDRDAAICQSVTRCRRGPPMGPDRTSWFRRYSISRLTVQSVKVDQRQISVFPLS